MQLELNHCDCLAWIGQADVLENLQRYEEALESYSKVAQFEPANEFDLSIKALALCKLKRYKEAFDCCEKVLQCYPNYAYALYCKACCYVDQNDVTLAIETLKQAVQISPRQTKNALRFERIFDPIRENPLFKQIIEN